MHLNEIGSMLQVVIDLGIVITKVIGIRWLRALEGLVGADVTQQKRFGLASLSRFEAVDLWPIQNTRWPNHTGA